MYYKKHFQGVIENDTTAPIYKIDSTTKLPSSTSIGNVIYYKRANVIGEALASTLKDCGLSNAYYDSTAHYLFFDKINCNNGIYIQIVSTSSSINILLGGNVYTSSDTLINGTVCGTICSSSNLPFSSTNVSCDYNFYITIKGDTNTFCKISIGSYSNPASEEEGTMYLCKIQNENDFTSYYGILSNSKKSSISSNNYLYITNSGNIPKYLPPYSSFTYTSLLSSASKTLDDEIYIYQDRFEYPVLKILDTYNSNLSVNDAFYTIGNDTYYKWGCFLTKCTTIPTPTIDGGND